MKKKKRKLSDDISGALPPPPPPTPPPPPPMSADAVKAADIFWKLQTSRLAKRLEVARADYLAAFGRAYDDESVDRDYKNHVESYFGSPRAYTWFPAKAALPAPIVLAYYLRSVARPGSLPKSEALAMQDDAQMEEVRRLVAEYITTAPYKRRKGKAQEKAAEEVARSWSYRGKRENLLTVEQMLERLRKPEKYGPGK
jgi:hypothetical protein